MDLHNKSLAELSAGLDKGDFSSVELTAALLDRIATHNESLNAFVTVTAEQAMADAAEADAARSSGSGWSCLPVCRWCTKTFFVRAA